jgi:hypothetical protein
MNYRSQTSDPMEHIQVQKEFASMKAGLNVANVPTPEIPRLLDRLQNSLDMLEKNAAMLTEKLQPVIADYPQTPNEANVKDTGEARDCPGVNK